MSVLLALFYFFYFAIIGVYIIFMPKILSTIGYSPMQIGMIFAAVPLVRFIMPFAFVKKFKLDEKVFIIALFILLFSSISFYFSLYNFYGLLATNIGLGIGLGLTIPYVEVVSLSHVGKHRYGKIRLFGSLGFILVALVLVKFLDSADVALKYLIFLSVCTVVVAYFITRFLDASIKTQDEQNDINLLKDWQLWLGLTLMQVSFGAFYNFFTIYETNNGISLDMTVYLWSFGVIAEVLMLFSQGRLLKGNLLIILQFTTFATAIRWLLLFLFPQNLPLLFLSQSMHALSFALFHSSAISYLYQLYKHKSLAQQFFSGITYGFGAFIGALIAGYVYEVSPKYLFLHASVLAFLAFLSIYMWDKKQNK